MSDLSPITKPGVGETKENNLTHLIIKLLPNSLVSPSPYSIPMDGIKNILSLYAERHNGGNVSPV
jgi:hypothetical protein